ncbi:MAG TPA: hypothetical protein VGE74_03435 [Gemmata sp.]
MEPLPEKPTGCEITEATDAGGVTLSWPAHKAGTRYDRFATAGFLLFWLTFWTLGGVTAVATLVNGRRTAFENAFLVVWLVGWAFGEWFVILALRDMFRSPTSESVRLEADALKYDPGRGPSELRSCAELPDGTVTPVHPAPATRAPKLAIQGFGIDRVNNRPRLYFDTEGRRVEIGGCLTESERVWLFAVLQRWLGKPRPTPPWSRAALKNQEGTRT